VDAVDKIHPREIATQASLSGIPRSTSVASVATGRNAPPSIDTLSETDDDGAPVATPKDTVGVRDEATGEGSLRQKRPYAWGDGDPPSDESSEKDTKPGGVSGATQTRVLSGERGNGKPGSGDEGTNTFSAPFRRDPNPRARRRWVDAVGKMHQRETDTQASELDIPRSTSVATGRKAPPSIATSSGTDAILGEGKAALLSRQGPYAWGDVPGAKPASTPGTSAAARENALGDTWAGPSTLDSGRKNGAIGTMTHTPPYRDHGASKPQSEEEFEPDERDPRQSWVNAAERLQSSRNLGALPAGVRLSGDTQQDSSRVGTQRRREGDGDERRYAPKLAQPAVQEKPSAALGVTSRYGFGDQQQTGRDDGAPDIAIDRAARAYSQGDGRDEVDVRSPPVRYPQGDRDVGRISDAEESVNSAWDHAARSSRAQSVYTPFAADKTFQETTGPALQLLLRQASEASNVGPGRRTGPVFSPLTIAMVTSTRTGIMPTEREIQAVTDKDQAVFVRDDDIGENVARRGGRHSGEQSGGHSGGGSRGGSGGRADSPKLPEDPLTYIQPRAWGGGGGGVVGGNGYMTNNMATTAAAVVATLLVSVVAAM
jgi:hypothetical protein